MCKTDDDESFAKDIYMKVYRWMGTVSGSNPVPLPPNNQLNGKPELCYKLHPSRLLPPCCRYIPFSEINCSGLLVPLRFLTNANFDIMAFARVCLCLFAYLPVGWFQFMYHDLYLLPVESTVN